MEHAPLRPVPSRRAGPADPATATGAAAAALPWLDAVAAHALGLVALADRPRSEVAASLRVDDEELAAMLAAARKELRRTVAALAGSGWCERAERHISDRLDGALADRDARRLDAHLRNCPRCVEHERRLVQATDALLSGLRPPRPPEPVAPPAAPAPPPAAAVPEPEEPEAPVEDAARDHVPVEAPTAEEVAAAAEVIVVARTRRQLAAAWTWYLLVVLAVVLVLAAIVVAVAGVLGADL